MSLDDSAALFKDRADTIIQKFRGQYPSAPISRRIEMLLKNAIARDFPDLQAFDPSVIFRDGRPLVFLVAKADNSNSARN